MTMIRSHVVLWAGLLISVVSLWAQDNRATLGGRVIDAQDAAMPGVTVVVTSNDTRVQQKTVTNIQGEWRILFLNPGRYSIVVSARGFKTSERKDFELQTADIKQIDIALELGA